MSFDELIELLRNPGTDGIQASVYDDLQSLHDKTLSEISGFEGVVAEKDARIKELEAEVSALKYRIAELEGDTANDVDDSDSVDDFDNSTISIDDLFEGDK